MKKVIQTLSEKWPEYLIESFVIVASILGAYALDNWNENRKLLSQEKVFIENLYADLKIDSAHFSYYAQTYRRIKECHIQLYKIGIQKQEIDSVIDPSFVRRSLYFRQLVNKDYLDNSPDFLSNQTRDELIEYVRVTSDFEEQYQSELLPMINKMREYLEKEEVYNASDWFEIKTKVFGDINFKELDGKNIVDKDLLIELSKTRPFQQVLFQLNMKWNEFNTRFIEIQQANRKPQSFIQSELSETVK